MSNKLIIKIFKISLIKGIHTPLCMSKVILLAACIVYLFSHFIFLFLSSICVFIGVIAHTEPDDINEGLSINFLIPENTVAQIKFLWSLFYNRMMQLHFICYFKWFHLGSTAKRAKQSFWKDFPSIYCSQFLNNLNDVVRGFYCTIPSINFSRENMNLKALVTGSYPESCIKLNCGNTHSRANWHCMGKNNILSLGRAFLQKMILEEV